MPSGRVASLADARTLGAERGLRGSPVPASISSPAFSAGNRRCRCGRGGFLLHGRGWGRRSGCRSCRRGSRRYGFWSARGRWCGSRSRRGTGCGSCWSRGPVRVWEWPRILAVQAPGSQPASRLRARALPAGAGVFIRRASEEGGVAWPRAGVFSSVDSGSGVAAGPGAGVASLGLVVGAIRRCCSVLLPEVCFT